MADFKLTAGWDMDFTQRRAHLVYDVEYRSQRLKIALLHVMGEWFRDESAGTDYVRAIWGKSTDLSRRAEFRRRCLQVPGIREIKTMDLQLVGSTRKLVGSIVVIDDRGNEIEARFTGRE